VLPRIDYARCDGCGACVTACPLGVLALHAGMVAIVKPEQCDYCGLCEAACPEMAITCPFEVVLARPAHRPVYRPLVHREN
jgi:NAD-dependent dihydropyrimidine dehydrogenase PreA subunit